MVKGNAQRRIELAERRKLESFEEKERRLAGPSAATPSEVRARLLSDARGSVEAEAGLIAWVVTDGKFFCEDFFRTGTCPLKRCKFAHDETIAQLSRVPPTSCATVAPSSRLTVPMAAARGRRAESEKDGRSISPGRIGRARAASSDANDLGGYGGSGSGSGGGGGGSGCGGDVANTTPTAADEFPALKCVLLRAVNAGGVFVYDRTIRTQVRTDSPLRFISWGTRLVFDAANPTVFASYVEGEKAAGAAAAAREKEGKEMDAAARAIATRLALSEGGGGADADANATTSEAATSTTASYTDTPSASASLPSATASASASPPASPRPRVHFS